MTDLKVLRLFVLILSSIFSDSLDAQDFCQCGSDFFVNIQPGLPEIFSREILAKEKVGVVSVYAGTVADTNSIKQESSGYRIYRFLFVNGKMIERIHFEAYGSTKRTLLGYPEEYEKYVYFGDTMCIRHSTMCTAHHYDKRFVGIRSDHMIDNYLKDGVDLKQAILTDLHFDKNGRVTKYKVRHPSTKQVLPDNKTQTIWFKYDSKGQLIQKTTTINLMHFRETLDTTAHTTVEKTEIDYEKNAMVTKSVKDGSEIVLCTGTFDNQGTLIESLDELGRVISNASIRENDKGLLTEHIIVYTKPTDSDCGNMRREEYVVTYLPNGLPDFITYKTDIGSCSYVFKYGY